jgi:hypothetical protein
MTQEYKQLLLADLCGRVSYHPKGRVANARTGAMCDEWLTCATFQMFVNITNNCRLYLRPMSSMTEEEREEYRKFSYYGAAGIRDNDFTEMLAVPSFEKMDYLNSHHFDYRGLISKGLAIAVTKDNNPYKE